MCRAAASGLHRFPLMNNRAAVLLTSGMVVCCSLIFFNGCGDDTIQAPATAATEPTSDWTLGCGPGGGAERQQQVSYKHPEQQSCTKQPVRFQESKITDFHFDVDCDERKVTVIPSGSGGPSGLSSAARGAITESYPIQADDSFKGKTSYPQQIQSDGKGNLQCWVIYVVGFDGKAKCDRRDDGEWNRSLDVQSTVALHSADPSVLGGHPSPGPSVSPSPSPGVSPSPEPSPSPSLSPSPSPSLSPSPSPSPSISPRPSATPIIICVIDNNNACPWVGDGHMGC
jgi:hypothetical protein